MTSDVEWYREGYLNGRRAGRAEPRRYDWFKLFVVVFAASFCAFAAVWALVTFL